MGDHFSLKMYDKNIKAEISGVFIILEVRLTK